MKQNGIIKRILQKNKKCLKSCFLLLGLAGMVCVVSGCTGDSGSVNDMKNVEERDYATVLLITAGEAGQRYHAVLGIAKERRVGENVEAEELSQWNCDTLEGLAQEYQQVKGKDLSLSHLKVILLGVEESDFVDTYWHELLYMLDDNSEIAKTCPVLKLNQQEELIDEWEDQDEPMGSYLQRLIQAMEKQGGDIPWLKDYMKAIREETGLQQWYLRCVDEGWKLVS